MNRLLISVVNWNTREALRRCLAALRPVLDHHDARVIVVDNDSADGSAEMVEREFPEMALIRAPRNLGFAGGNNIAIAAGDDACDYVLVMNPDVVLAPGAVERLIAFLQTTPAAAAVAPLLTDADGRAQTHMYRRFPTRAQVALFWTVLRPLSSRIGPLRRRLFEHDLRSREPVRVDQLPGAAMLVRAAALRTVGLMDAGYFVWWEDVDWCYRATAAGLTLHVLPDVECRHEGGASFAAWSVETRVFQFYRAFYRFLARHGLRDLARAVTPVIAADLALKQALLGLRWWTDRPVGLDDARTAIREGRRNVERGFVPDFDSAATATGSRTREALQRAAAPDPGAGAGTVDVVIVNWNGRRWLPQCLAALQRSTIPVQIVVVDNASTDGSTDLVRAAHPDVELIVMPSNAGYAAGANRGLAVGRARYAFVMNPDVIVEADHLEILRDRLDADPLVGAAQGKLFSLTPAEFTSGIAPRRVLDSAGHEILRSRMVVDRGQGEPDGARYDYEASIFSACGAALFLRRAMLDDIAPDRRYFEDSFFAYKEDIDLGWRARLMGWEVLYVPRAVAHHVRALPFGAGAWKHMSARARRHSWKNHYLLMIRNDRLSDVLRSLPSVVAWEVGRLGHALLRDPQVLPAYIDVARSWRQVMRDRRTVQSRRRASHASMRVWFGAAAMPLRERPRHPVAT